MVIWHVSRDLGLVENHLLWQIIIAVAGGLIFYASLGSGIFLKTLFSRLKREDENDRRRFYIKMGNYSLFLALSCFGLSLFYLGADFFKNDNAWESMAKNPNAVSEFFSRHRLLNRLENRQLFFRPSAFWKLTTKQEFYWDFFVNNKYGMVIPQPYLGGNIWEYPPHFTPLKLPYHKDLNYPWVTFILSKLEYELTASQARLSYVEGLAQADASEVNIRFLDDSVNLCEKTELIRNIINEVVRENTPHKRAARLLELLETFLPKWRRGGGNVSLEWWVVQVLSRNGHFWNLYLGLNQHEQNAVFQQGVPDYHWGLVSLGGFEFEGIPGYNSPVPELYSDLRPTPDAPKSSLSRIWSNLVNFSSWIKYPKVTMCLGYTYLIFGFLCYREALKSN